MPHRLGEHEHRVEQRATRRGERQLAGRELRARSRLVVNVGSTRLSVARVTTVASAAPVPSALNDARCRARSAPTSSESADDPVARDHHRGEDGVPRQRRRCPCRRHHQRHDQRHLDHRHRDREDQRAERLAHPVGDHLGVVDGGEHARPQEYRRTHQQRPTPAGCTTPGGAASTTGRATGGISRPSGPTPLGAVSVDAMPGNVPLAPCPPVTPCVPLPAAGAAAPAVQKPIQYVGGELNSTVKDWD